MLFDAICLSAILFCAALLRFQSHPDVSCYFLLIERSIMPNFPGPYSVEFVYQALTREHSMELNCAAIGNPPPGTAVASITLATKGGGSIALQTGVQNFWNFYRLGHGVTSSLLEWRLWKYTTGTYEKAFVAGGTVTNPLGGAGSANAMRQAIASFRTASGGIMYVEWLEGNTALDTSVVLTPSGVGAYQQQVASYLLSSEGWAIGRDDSFPISALKFSQGQNEALWRKVNRPNS
jgi:hypothetical protein